VKSEKFCGYKRNAQEDIVYYYKYHAFYILSIIWKISVRFECKAVAIS
jgi:hypothetical protein